MTLSGLPLEPSGTSQPAPTFSSTSESQLWGFLLTENLKPGIVHLTPRPNAAHHGCHPGDIQFIAAIKRLNTRSLRHLSAGSANLLPAILSLLL